MIKFLWLVHALLNKLSLEASFLEIHHLEAERTHKHALEACLKSPATINWQHTLTDT